MTIQDLLCNKCNSPNVKSVGKDFVCKECNSVLPQSYIDEVLSKCFAEHIGVDLASGKDRTVING
ncbi:hypothetical protein IMX26_13160 [Clostridium sp. 'deep sea']|uniref:hypothetical protein n=1 Tax=Clostridium sp. 'deep sea' TaxID=2779445 RepID=UPI0018964643|nr:hypothetical protein [Clostridium sp. 'deep sea']QOR34432.1 hypothetical protein IMX26_13160 [Clostridium sp. 'deep sea']